MVQKLKSKLVAKRFQQNLGIDYSETFSPVVKTVTISSILALHVSFEWKVHQVDSYNAFPNGELQEEVFMTQPKGFENLEDLLMFVSYTKPCMI